MVEGSCDSSGAATRRPGSPRNELPRLQRPDMNNSVRCEEQRWLHWSSSLTKIRYAPRAELGVPNPEYTTYRPSQLNRRLQQPNALSLKAGPHLPGSNASLRLANTSGCTRRYRIEGFLQAQNIGGTACSYCVISREHLQKAFNKLMSGNIHWRGLSDGRKLEPKQATTFRGNIIPTRAGRVMWQREGSGGGGLWSGRGRQVVFRGGARARTVIGSYFVPGEAGGVRVEELLQRLRIRCRRMPHAF